MADTVGQADLRAENVSKVVTGFALCEYVFKQLSQGFSPVKSKTAFIKSSDLVVLLASSKHNFTLGGLLELHNLHIMLP